MKWTVLTDNRTTNDHLITEHGLSILLETERHRILLDTGASDVFLRNAETLGVDLQNVDYLFLSHGHSDHTGGLAHFLNINHRARVIVAQDAVGGRYFSRRKGLHSISAPWPEALRSRAIFVNESCTLDGDLHILAHIPQRFPLPQANCHLFVQDADGNYVPDDFRHELVLYTEGVLFTGCAHSGIENILAACPWKVNMAVGGLHCLDDHESEEELNLLAHRLKNNYPHTHIYTSHCTGDKVFATLQREMGELLQPFACGTEVRV